MGDLVMYSWDYVLKMHEIECDLTMTGLNYNLNMYDLVFDLKMMRLGDRTLNMNSVCHNIWYTKQICHAQVILLAS